MLIANASKSQIRDKAKMLEVLDCSKSYLLGLCQKLLSVKNDPSLKLFGFYKLSSGLKHVWAFYFLSASKDLESFFKCQVFTLHRQSPWEDLRRKNLLSARGRGPQSSFTAVVESKTLWEQKHFEENLAWAPAFTGNGSGKLQGNFLCAKLCRSLILQKSGEPIKLRSLRRNLA